MNIGEKIRIARLKKGLSQENMAELLYLSTTAYGDIERNKTEVTVNRLLKISKILEVNLEEILDEFSQKSKNDDEVKRLKAELLLANIESLRWKERFMRSVFADNATRQNQERKRIGFK
jgi:XRE family transcriptional regulator, regulator of sulfur utilization